MLDRTRFVKADRSGTVVQLDGALLRIDDDHQRRTGA